jgi:hypothetical protein
MEHILLANNAAASQSTENADSLTGTCPYMNPMIQLVPMRYAMSEEGEMLPDNLNGSLYRHKDIPQGIRPLNPGFLYLIHSEDKDTLYEFEVKKDQSLVGRYFEKGTDAFQSSGLTGIVVPRRGTLQTLFMPVAITTDRADILLGAKGDQSHLMTRVLLGSVDPLVGTKGLLPTSQIPTGIDFSGQRVEFTKQDDLGKYLWLDHLTFQPEAQAPIKSSVLQKYEKDSAVLLVNDICGDLVEVAERQNNLKTQYQSWYTKEVNGHRNGDRYEIAQLLNNLMQIDQFLAGRLDALLAELGATVSDDKRKALLVQLKKHIEVLNDPNEQRWEATIGSSYPANMGQIVNDKADAMSKALADEYSLSYFKVKSTMEKLANDYRHLVEGDVLGKDGIKTVIRYDDMQNFVKEWDDYRDSISESLAHLNPYVKTMAPKWTLLAAYISPKKKEDFKIKLDYEDILTAFFKNNDDQWLLDYYTGDNHFSLSVYDDIATGVNVFSAKNASNIAKKFIGLEDTLKGVGSFEKKMQKANDLSSLNKILDEDLKARVLQSLSLKNEAFVVSMTAALKTSGGEMNFTQRLNANFDSLSKGAKQLLHLNFKMNDVQWHIPDEKAASRLQSLHQELDQTRNALTEAEQSIVKIKGRNDAILKMPKSARAAARGKYVAELRLAKADKSRLLTQYRTQYNDIISHSGPETSLGISKNGSYPMTQAMDEAKQMVKRLNARGTIREMLMAEGKPSAAKIAKNSASFLLAYLYVWSAWNAWEALADDTEEEGELLNFTAAGITATAALISSAGTIYSAWLNASLKVGEAELQAATLARLAKWGVYSTPITTAMGTIAMGFRTWDAGKDFYNTFSSDGRWHKILSFTRAALSFGGFIAGGIESIRYTVTAIKLITGAIETAEAALLETLSIAARFIRWNVALWVAFFVVDQLWQYYKWPPLVDWADDTAWGNGDKKWSLTEHYEALSPQSFTPSTSYELVNNTYTETNTAETEVQLSFFLPNVLLPTAENCKLEIKAYSCIPKNRRTYTYKWTDVFNELKTDMNVSPKNGGCEITLFVRSDWIEQHGIMQLRCRFAISNDGINWHQNNWDYRISRALYIPFTEHNVLNISRKEIDASGSHLVPWS